jgi:hypothetical protein
VRRAVDAAVADGVAHGVAHVAIKTGFAHVHDGITCARSDEAHGRRLCYVGR